MAKKKIDFSNPVPLKKDEFCSIVAEKAGITKKNATKAVNAFIETIQEQVGAGKSITFLKFGTFKVAHRNARTGRNPQTGEEIDIPASDKLAFSSKVSF